MATHSVADIMAEVREAMEKLTHRTGEVEIPAVVAAETMKGLWDLATRAVALMDRLEMVEGFVVYEPEHLRKLVADDHFRVYGKCGVSDLAALLLTTREGS